MRRRKFIQTGLQFGILISSVNGLALNKWLQNPYDELIGKGKPDLVGADIKFRKETYEAFVSMRAEARKAGLDIRAISAYRSFSRQKLIWERKFKSNLRKGLGPRDNISQIIQYSTIPGTSRHHWGTDIDIIDGKRMTEVAHLLSPSNFDAGQPFYDLGKWLGEHAAAYDFHLVYTDEPGRKGFKYEPWHFSFKPLSKKYLGQFLELNLIEILQNERFSGTEFFDASFIEAYREEHILDINPELLV